MKKTIIAIILLMISIPILIMGGNIYASAIYLLSLIGLNEFLNIKNEKKEIPQLIKIISFLALTSIVLSSDQTLIFKIDYRILTGIFTLLLIPTVLYHDKDKYSVNDAFYLIGSILFLGIAFSLMIIIRNINLNITIYILLISIVSDIYAMITGKLIGSKKLSKEISPNKTLEGLLGGLAFGTFVPVVFYKTVINTNKNLLTLTIVTLFLCMLGQIGDLCFSAIKRYFEKKDFSKLIPEHGGILDRLDSIIFILMGYMFFINIIGG